MTKKPEVLTPEQSKARLERNKRRLKALMDTLEGKIVIEPGKGLPHWTEREG